MTSPRTAEEFAERVVYPSTNEDPEVESVGPGMFGGVLVEYADGWVWGIRVDLVQRGDD